MEKPWEATLEAERLRLSSPDAVYNHLSSLPIGDWLNPNLPDIVFDALAARGDALIDLALARYASNTKKLEALFSRGGILRLAVLANRAAWGPLKGPLDADNIVDVHRNGTAEELAALMQNPSVDPSVLRGAIANTLGGGVDEERWRLVISLVAGNERLTYTKAHDTWDEFTTAMDHEAPIAAVWDLLWTVEPTPAWAGVLGTLLARIPFAGKIRDEFMPDLKTEEGQRDWKDSWKERWERYHDAFIEMVAAKWASPANLEKYSADYWRYLRQAFGEKLIQSRQFDGGLVEKLRNHTDIGFRCGYYRGSRIDRRWPLQEFYGRDGTEFLEAVVDNEHLYLRQNHALQSSIRSLLRKVDSGDDWLIGLFKNMQKRWAEKNPALYGDEPTPEQAEEERREWEAEQARAERKQSRAQDKAPDNANAAPTRRRGTAATRLFWMVLVGAALVAWLSTH